MTTTNTQAHRPDQVTSVPNLVLAGAHTRTEADIWSIEGAVESGRRAAKVFEPGIVVIGQHKPLPIAALARVDDGLYALRLPHVLSVVGATAAIAVLRLAFGPVRSVRCR